MNLFDTIRVLADDAVGTRGALENCRIELDRARRVDAQVERLRSRFVTSGVPVGAAESVTA